jgi:hypothetical protein
LLQTLFVCRRRVLKAKQLSQKLIKMLEQLGHYVEAACNDDPAIFSTSGFTAVSNTRTHVSNLIAFLFSQSYFSERGDGGRERQVYESKRYSCHEERYKGYRRARPGSGF